MAAVLDPLLACFAQFADVWFARHRELAQWAVDSASDEITCAPRFSTEPRAGRLATR